MYTVFEVPLEGNFLQKSGYFGWLVFYFWKMYTFLVRRERFRKCALCPVVFLKRSLWTKKGQHFVSMICTVNVHHTQEPGNMYKKFYVDFKHCGLHAGYTAEIAVGVTGLQFTHHSLHEPRPTDNKWVAAATLMDNFLWQWREIYGAGAAAPVLLHEVVWFGSRFERRPCSGNPTAHNLVRLLPQTFVSAIRRKLLWRVVRRAGGRWARSPKHEEGRHWLRSARRTCDVFRRTITPNDCSESNNKYKYLLGAHSVPL